MMRIKDKRGDRESSQGGIRRGEGGGSRLCLLIRLTTSITIRTPGKTDGVHPKRETFYLDDTIAMHLGRNMISPPKTRNSSLRRTQKANTHSLFTFIDIDSNYRLVQYRLPLHPFPVAVGTVGFPANDSPPGNIPSSPSHYTPFLFRHAVLTLRVIHSLITFKSFTSATI
ncbi:hypothetical protein E2C01_061097 [Portunus trituberculatus]|uniref:Uncharacterized protein n=1 Tax=Portunus trituberculatus TaxID=210409 RepID=A0A5B7HDF6_PORTR|nr:hypothetical protein [Portunus trituberculatus]